jgi:hypothetical protein
MATTIAVPDFIGGRHGTLEVAFEEGNSCGLAPRPAGAHVAEVLVCDPRPLPCHRRENKNDKIDAQQLAQGLRLGVLKPVYHSPAGLHLGRIGPYLPHPWSAMRVPNPTEGHRRATLRHRGGVCITAIRTATCSCGPTPARAG